MGPKRRSYYYCIQEASAQGNNTVPALYTVGTLLLSFTTRPLGNCGKGALLRTAPYLKQHNEQQQVAAW